MPKTVQYDSLVERDFAMMDTAQILLRLIRILEEMHPGFYEEGVNKLFPTPNGEPHKLEYTKPV